MIEIGNILAQVMQLHAQYADAVFRGDLLAFGECFAEECEWRLSGQILSGRVEAVERVRQTFIDARRVYITFATPIITVSPEGEIGARTYMNERCSWNNGDKNIVIGRYFERFINDGGRLRFAWRLWEGLYVGPADLSGIFYDTVDHGPPPSMPANDYIPPAMQ